MHLELFAQTNPTSASLIALVRRLVRGGIGAAQDPATTVLLLIAWFTFLGLITVVVQQDRKKWLRGLVDIRGHFEQLAAGLDILRRNKRPLWVLLTAAVLSWSGWSLRTWQETGSKDELEAILANYDNSAARFAAVHALSTALAPLRNLVALGDTMPMLLGACVLLFARTTHLSHALRSRTRAVENVLLKRRLGGIWLCLIVLAAYRSVLFIATPDSAPLVDCLFVNALLVPIIWLAADALLLSWVLVEFGRAINGNFDWQPDDSVAFVRMIPAAAIACVLLSFGRYVLLFSTLLHAQFATPNWSAQWWHAILATYNFSQLFGLAWLAFPGVLVINRRTGIVNQLKTYFALIRRVGGQIVGLSIVSVLLSFLAVLPFYWIFGAMQRETWSLLGAASYGHYVTLILGIIVLAAFTQLAHRELGMLEPELPKPALIPMPAGPEIGFPASEPVSAVPRPESSMGV